MAERAKEAKTKVTSFRDLVVWQKAHQLVLEIYRITQIYQPEEKFGLVSQMRRAAVSVAANIVEGFRRKGSKDNQQFLVISLSSLDEVAYYNLLSRDLGYVSAPTEAAMANQIDEIARMLHASIRYLEGH
jgi:four helix bundle protein